jgi:excinuclease UvrABC ATPase subunit
MAELENQKRTVSALNRELNEAFDRASEWSAKAEAAKNNADALRVERDRLLDENKRLRDWKESASVEPKSFPFQNPDEPCSECSVAGEKPPLGLVPRKIVDEDRAREISVAILGYELCERIHPPVVIDAENGRKP